MRDPRFKNRQVYRMNLEDDKLTIERIIKVAKSGAGHFVLKEFPVRLMRKAQML